MATKTISELPGLSNIAGDESIPIVQNGTTYQCSPNQLLNEFAPSFLSSAGGSISGALTINSGGAQITGDTTITGTTSHVGNTTVTGTLKASGNISGSGTPTTTMTAGFVHIPKAAGTPSGTPTAITGFAPLYFDSTNNRLYVYNTTGGWKSTLLA
jgi:hypothetical protein